MYSEKGLKKFAIICIIMSVIVFGFACYGLVLLSDHRHLLATDFDLLFFFLALFPSLHYACSQLPLRYCLLPRESH